MLGVLVRWERRPCSQGLHKLLGRVQRGWRHSCVTDKNTPSSALCFPAGRGGGEVSSGQEKEEIRSPNL